MVFVFSVLICFKKKKNDYVWQLKEKTFSFKRSVVLDQVLSLTVVSNVLLTHLPPRIL